MPTVLEVENFLALAQSRLVCDVRSPAEFEQGHWPDAESLPLFNNEERAEVGLTYKQRGRCEAVLCGLERIGPRMASMVRRVLQLLQGASSGAGASCPAGSDRENGGATGPDVLLYCWRGGMRSQSVAWLLEQAGLQVGVLDGGYKSIRRHVLQSFERPLPLRVVSGLTGAGKTLQLGHLVADGHQVLDLEALANHRGSAFGGIGLGGQPTNEQFENRLCHRLAGLSWEHPIWVEDESRKIGQVILPVEFYDQLKSAPAVFLDVPLEGRVQVILDEYGDLDRSAMQTAIERITKRLGGQNANAALELLTAGDMAGSVRVLLEYYDRTYLTGKSRLNRTIFHNLPVVDPGAADVARQIVATLGNDLVPS